MAVRQIALSRFIGATLVANLWERVLGGLIAEGIGWRVMVCAAALGIIAAGAAITMLLKGGERESRTTPRPRLWLSPATAWC